MGRTDCQTPGHAWGRGGSACSAWKHSALAAGHSSASPWVGVHLCVWVNFLLPLNLIQPKPPKGSLYTSVRGLLGPEKPAQGKRNSLKGKPQLLLWAYGRISGPCWMRATVSLPVPVELIGRFCTLLIYICLHISAVSSICLGKQQTRHERNMGFRAPTWVSLPPGQVTLAKGLSHSELSL